MFDYLASYLVISATVAVKAMNIIYNCSIIIGPGADEEGQCQLGNIPLGNVVPSGNLQD